jgi:lipopolysaccharide transport protein LptA
MIGFSGSTEELTDEATAQNGRTTSLFAPHGGHWQDRRPDGSDQDGEQVDRRSGRPQRKVRTHCNVRITQGTIVATGDQAEIYTGPDSQVTRVVLTGARAHLEQMDDQDHLMQADARRIDYDLATGQAVLTGEASARKAGMGVSTAPKILYNTDDGTFSAEGTEADPVHMTLYPSARKTKP